MRVLQLGPYSPPHGGIQANVVALRRYLREQGVQCLVIDLNRLRRTDGTGVFGPRNALHLLWLLCRLPADVVHLHIGGDLTTRLLGLSLICGWLPGRKSVLTFHSGGYPSSSQGQRANRNTLRGWILRQFDRVIAVNQELVDLFGRYGLPPDHIRLIQPHSLPAEPPVLELPEPLRSFCAAHGPVILSVGLLEAEYDLPLQIDLLGLLRATYPAAGLILIGSGSLQAEIADRINEKPYRQHILLCGDVERSVTLRMIADCNLFLRTTRFDGDSISVREALHFGVPVVASDSASRPEGTYLFRAGDLLSLRGVAEEVLREKARRAPQRTAREENLEAVAELYRELVGE
jgi:glycogen(starch) synthase